MIVATTRRAREVALHANLEYVAVTRLPEDLRDDPSAIVAEVARVLDYDDMQWVATQNAGELIRISEIQALKYR